MHVLQLVPLVLATACFLAPAEKNAPPGQPPAQSSDPFPAPKAGLSITVAPGDEMSLGRLLEEFSKVTGHSLLISADTCNGLKNTPTGLNRSVEIPPAEVYAFVERILRHHGFALALLNDREPRLLGVYFARDPQSTLREVSTFVPAERIAGFARHPAFLVTTIVDLPSSDVRTLSNTLRSMFTDANTQQIIPGGNSNSLVLQGMGSNVADLVAVLRLCDESSRIALERHEKERAERRAREAEQKQDEPK